MKNFTRKFIGLLTLVFVTSFSINAQQIGDIYEGGYIFQINENGTGLVVMSEDIGVLNWYEAETSINELNYEGYDDWYFPSVNELVLIYNSVGPGGDNSASFNNDGQSGQYWSSTNGRNS